MSQKTNLRSFRFSDEVAGILEGFEGGSLNAKFENLVLHCFWERKKIDQDIARKKAEYAKLCGMVDAKREELYDLNTLTQDRNRITKEISSLAILICDYREKLKKDVTQLNLAARVPGCVDCVTSAKRA